MTNHLQNFVHTDKYFHGDEESLQHFSFFVQSKLFPTVHLGLLLHSSNASTTSLPSIAISLMLFVAGIVLAKAYVNTYLKAHVAQKGKKDA